LARAHEVGELAGIGRPYTNALCGVTDAVGKAPKGSVPGRVSMTCQIVSSVPCSRNLPRAAVVPDEHQRRLAKKRDQFAGLLFATEEEVGLIAIVGLEPDEGLALDGELGAGLKSQHGAKQLPELVGSRRFCACRQSGT